MRAKRSLLSIPGLLGMPPKNIATSISVNAILGSAVITTPSKSENAQSSSYILIPSSSCSLASISSKYKKNLYSPKTYPDPKRG